MRTPHALYSTRCSHTCFRNVGSKRTYFVILKIRNNLRARNTLIPKDVPGFMMAQITSKMLPMITCRRAKEHIGGLQKTLGLCAGTLGADASRPRADGMLRTGCVFTLTHACSQGHTYVHRYTCAPTCQRSPLCMHSHPATHMTH